VLIVWHGPSVCRRVVGRYAWGPENNWQCAVADQDAPLVLASDALFAPVVGSKRASTRAKVVAVEGPVDTGESGQEESS
jgi:hypothetical protein